MVCVEKDQKISEISSQLSHEQQIVGDKITINLNEYSVTLFDCETGSEKTEVYLSVITKLVNTVTDVQVLILLPEVILTSQLVIVFVVRYQET
ncbi:MAG: hypothetical protein ACR5K2_04590 [Wolbachia sp.]